MIVRTYTAELTGPPVTISGLSVRPVRRLRAWDATVSLPWATLGFKRARAVPAAVEVTSGGSRPERHEIRSPEAPALGALRAGAAASPLITRRWRR